MPKLTKIAFAQCHLGFSSAMEEDEDGTEVKVWTLNIVDPDGPTQYSLSFNEEIRDILLEQLQGSGEVQVASVADLRKLAEGGAAGLPRA